MVELKSENYSSLGILTDNSDFYFEDVSEIDNTENSIWGKLFFIVCYYYLVGFSIII